jgi:hypothetical protein
MKMYVVEVPPTPPPKIITLVLSEGEADFIRFVMLHYVNNVLADDFAATPAKRLANGLHRTENKRVHPYTDYFKVENI